MLQFFFRIGVVIVDGVDVFMCCFAHRDEVTRLEEQRLIVLCRDDVMDGVRWYNLASFFQSESVEVIVACHDIIAQPLPTSAVILFT